MTFTQLNLLICTHILACVAALFLALLLHGVVVEAVVVGPVAQLNLLYAHSLVLGHLRIGDGSTVGGRFFEGKLTYSTHPFDIQRGK